MHAPMSRPPPPTTLAPTHPHPTPHPHPHPHLQSAQHAPDRRPGRRRRHRLAPALALVGPALVIDVAADANVTAALLATPTSRGTPRACCSGRSTRGGGWCGSPRLPRTTSGSTPAARWLAEERPGVRLVGIDYLSIGAMYDIVEAHKTLFRKVGLRSQGAVA